MVIARVASPLAMAMGASSVLLLGACDATDAHEPRSVAELRAYVAADSAAGDSAALATLPPRLQDVLRLESFLTDAYLASSADAECRVDGPGVEGRDGARELLGTVAANTERRRVRALLPDGARLTVTVRVPADGAALERVEIVHRPADGDARGWIWDGARDATLEARWPAHMRGRTERAPQPRGGPVPRAVRALGRMVLGLSCEAAPAIEPVEADTTSTAVRELIADEPLDGPSAP